MMTKLQQWWDKLDDRVLVLALIATVLASAFGGCWTAYETRAAAHFEQRVTEKMFGSRAGGV